MHTITSFGYRHGAPPSSADLVLDVRDLIRDPHVDPQLRQMTGHDEVVVAKVMGTPGTQALVDVIVQAVTVAAQPFSATYQPADIHVAIGCQGGRHRSVVLADRVAQTLRDGGHEVAAVHRDIDRPVVQR